MRWKLAIEKYIKEQGYKIGTLVAFSGEVIDTESGPDPFTETQHGAEPRPEGPRHPRGVQGRRVPDAARRQQVPDRLRPAAAVRHVRRQAAGRHPGGADALAAEPRAPGQGHDLRRSTSSTTRTRCSRRSRPTTTTAELSATTDPNLVFDLRAKLDAAGHYDDFEVDRVVAVELNPSVEAERPRGGRSSRSPTA